MEKKASFIDRFAMECSPRNGSGAPVTSTTFLRTIMPRTELANLAVRLARWARLPVSYDEALEFVNAANYNVADLYDFLIWKRDERKTRNLFLFGKTLMGISVIVVFYSLYTVNFPLCFISMGVGSGAYKYLFPDR